MTNMVVTSISRQPKAHAPSSDRYCTCLLYDTPDGKYARDADYVKDENGHGVRDPNCTKCHGTGRYYRATEPWEWAQYRRDQKRWPRLYISPEKESVLENFTGGRFERPYVTFRKEVLTWLLPALGLDGATARWSQKAGCSMCPCSPGFILTGARVDFDIWVHYRVVGEVELTNRQRELATFRRQITGIESPDVDRDNGTRLDELDKVIKEFAS